MILVVINELMLFLRFAASGKYRTIASQGSQLYGP